MIRCYLDNQPVAAPRGLDSILFKKSRHRTYWGFTYRNLGFVDGVNVLGFTEQAEIDYLTQIYKKHGVMGETSFRLESDDDGILYDGWINYEQKSASAGLFSVALRDDQATSQLESQGTTSYNLMPSSWVRLTSRQLDGEANLELDTSRATVKRYLPGSGAFIDHSLPTAPTADKEKPVVGSLLGSGEPLSNSPFYQNTTSSPQQLRLRGRFDVATECNFPGLVGWRLLGAIEGPLPIGQAVLAASRATITMAVDITCTVPVGGTLTLNAYMPNDASSYTFVYSNLSLSLARVEVTPDSIVWGISAADALTQLIGRITKARKRVVISGLDKLFITNGLNLRGNASPVVLSLRTLFDGLNAIYNLYLDVQGDTVRIGPKTQIWQRGRLSYLTDITAFTETPNTELLFSELTVGYQSGAGNSLLSALDPNTSRTYSSELTTVRSPLNLTSSLITSGTLIEEQRRKQFDSGTSGSSKTVDYDQSLFLITTDGGRASANLIGIDSYSGLIDASTSYNLSITPRRNLERWRWLITAGGSLTLTNSDLRQQVITHYRGEADSISENQALIETVRTIPDVWQATAVTSLTQYATLGDWVELPDGRRGLLMDADWQLAETGPTSNLTLWEVPSPY